MNIDQLLQAALQDLSDRQRNMRARAQITLEQWHAERRRRGFPAEVDHSHIHDASCMLALAHHRHVCKEGMCSSDGLLHNPPHTCNSLCAPNMCLISTDLQLYGCVRSGRHHFCGSVRSHRCLMNSCPEEQRYHGCSHQRCVQANPLRHERCTDTMMSRDQELVCIFSGMTVGTYVTQSYYERREFADGRFFGTGDSQQQQQQHEDDEGSSVAEEQIHHECWEAEVNAKEKKKTKTKKQKQKKPVTRRRPVRSEPLPEDCDDSASSISSGRSDISAGTLGSPEDRAKRVQRRLDSLRDLENKAYRVVWDLLFDESNRERVNEHRRVQHATQFTSRASMYFEQAPGPYMAFTLMDIHRGEALEPMPSAPLEMRESMANYYAKLCVRVWKRLGVKRLPCAYHHYVMALLYTLPSGIRKNREIVMPPDEFLHKFLPSRNDLVHFRNSANVNPRKDRLARRNRVVDASSVPLVYKKKEITTGNRTLQNAIHHSSFALLRRSFEGADWDPRRFAERAADRSIQRKLQRLRAADGLPVSTSLEQESSAESSQEESD